MKNNYLPISPITIEKEEICTMNPIVLAFLGDSVQTLYVRTKLCINHKEKSGKLHILASQELKATSQAKAMKNILNLLTEEEEKIYKRARNSKATSPAKNANIIDYHIASGFEAVIGFLYLANETKRIEELLNVAYCDNEETNITEKDT